jgi:periplasmic protein TonB
MKREDWTGMSVSLGVHVLIILLLSLMTTAATENQPFGFLEVEFGPISGGRPVQQAPKTEQEVPEKFEEVEETVKQAAVAPPEVVKPVELPKQVAEVVSEDIVETPKAEVITPEKSKTEVKEEAPVPVPEKEIVKPLGSGSIKASEGKASGDEGESDEATKSAPYQIEGLNRAPLNTPIPAYTVQVDATIQFRIVVNPQGRIIQRIPVRKGDPTLERAVMEVLDRWQFNPLPADAPQENQSGTISFKFSRR